MVLSHVAHYLSVLALYRLSLNVFGRETPSQRLLCFLSAALHIISPGGAFLTSPCPEAVFSFLNIFGYYVYSSSHSDHGTGKAVSRHVKWLAAAVLFAVATTVRSNGILSGFLFAYDAVLQLGQVIRGPSLNSVVRLGVIGISGSIVALGMILPQYLAYSTFCTAEDTLRPWCQRTLPSIYSWVQEQYW